MPTFRIRIVADPTGIKPGRQQVSRELGKLENRSDQLRASLGKLFALAGGITAITRAIRIYANFEQTMAAVGAVSGATADELANLREEAKLLGATTRFSATDAAEGIELLSRAGFSAIETLETVGGVLLLAQAGALGLGQAADITSSILRGFQMDVSETSRVVDVLAAAAAGANTTVGRMGDAAKFVAPIAAGLGITLESTAASIMALSNAGLQATMAGTGLRRIIAELITPGKGLTDLLTAAGKSTDDINPRLNKLTDIFRTLKAAGVDANNALELFTIRGGPAILALLGSIPDIERFRKELEGSAGAAEEMARIMDDNLMGALLQVRSAFEAVVIEMGEAKDETVTNFFRDLATMLRAAAANVDVLVNALEVLVVVISIKLAQKAIGFLIARLAALKLAIATNPLGLMLTALTLGIGLLVSFADKISIGGEEFATLADLAVGAWEEIEKGAREVGIFIDAFFMGVGDLAKSVFGVDIPFTFRDMVIAAAMTFDQILGAATGVFIAIKELFTGPTATRLGEGFKLVFGTIWREGKLAFMRLANFLSSVFQDPVAAIAKSFLTLIGAIGGVAAVLSKLGLISETTRANFEDSVTALESLAKKKLGPLGEADLPYSKGDIAALESERDTFIDETTKKLNAAREESIQELIARLRTAFVEGAAGSAFLEQAIRNAFNRADQIAADRAVAERAKAEREAAAARAGKGLGPGGEAAAEAAEKARVALDANAASRIKALDTAAELTAQEEILSQVYAERPDLVDEINRAMDELRLKALDASLAMGDGFTRAFLLIKMEAQDMATVAENAVGAFVDNSADALAEFVRTGKGSFADLANAILDDLAQIFTRMLLIQALNMGLGAAGLTPGAAFGGGRQHGGPVMPGRSYIVGESGRERFEPDVPGRIVPEPTINVPVTVMNVENPDQVPAALTTRVGDRFVLNRLGTNKKVAKRMLS